MAKTIWIAPSSVHKPAEVFSKQKYLLRYVDCFFTLRGRIFFHMLSKHFDLIKMAIVNMKRIFTIVA